MSDEIIKDGGSLNLNENPDILPNGGYPMHTFEDVKVLFSTYIHDEKDAKMIEDAYNFVKIKHDGIKRKSGEPYLQHLIEVAYIVTALQSGPVTICAAFLHDVVEDTEVTVEDIRKKFGNETAKIVDSLTKIQRMKLSHRTEAEFVAEDHKKIFLGMAKDVRVIIIKLADRLHNLRTIKALKKERQLALANETLEVFAPIAHRLGIYKVESELEDLCLEITNHKEFVQISNLLSERIQNRQKSLLLLKKKIADILLEKNFKFEIESRVKSVYSIYKKMYLKGYTFDEIYDVLAVRIITESEQNCYEILGVIHSNFAPLPGRFKDYIAMPKPNMYQSLHTTVISGDGNFFEVQIRTHEMDEVAESGIAAHWRYKEGTNYNAKKEQQEIEEKLHWFREFIAVSNESKNENGSEYMESINKDIFEANVYVFTPKGKVIDLPNGSMPLDLAYKIHTKVGDSAVGAVVNNVLVPLNTVLKTGDVVEIKTSKTSNGPNESWLNLVKSNFAKSHIKKALLKKSNELLRDDKIKQGKDVFSQFLKEQELDEKLIYDQIDTKNVLDNYHCSNVDDLFIKISGHNPSPAQIIEFIGIKKKNTQETNKLSKKENFEDDNCPVTVDNQVGLKITLGNCCTPIPGDKIIGYVTRGYGITVHRVDCPNIVKQKSRLIDVHWKDRILDKAYPVDLVITCVDRSNLLADILNIINENKLKCTELAARSHPENGQCSITCQIYVDGANNLNKVMSFIKGMKDVIEIKRVFH